jgi:DNA (cytosine-5)-methyltransferase 1
MRVGELFAGIGGFGIGLERAGMRVVWHSEIDVYASAVLRKHWPNIPNHGDIRNIDAGSVEPVDVLCGGFPCQDISNAGKREGIDAERSGLWSEYARVIGALRPRYVIVENVSALLGRGLHRVLGDLAALGFDAEWHCIPASAVGAPHRRDRIWIIAHAVSRVRDWRTDESVGCAQGRIAVDGLCADVPDASGEGRRQELRGAHGDEGAHAGRSASHLHIAGSDGAVGDVADANSEQPGSGERAGVAEGSRTSASSRTVDTGDASGRGSRTRESDVADADDAGRSEQWRPLPIRAQLAAAERGGWWSVEPDVGRVALSVPSRVDRLRCLGNAIVPTLAEVIGRAMMERERG